MELRVLAACGGTALRQAATAWSRLAVAGILTIALAACAGTPVSRGTNGSRQGVAAPSASASPDSSGIAAPNPRTDMVRLALSMLGQPYRYGGAAPGGFDCSGLVRYAANGAGIQVPRTAHEQLRAGMPISRSELRPGDLVFMHLAHKELHVGIVIDDQDFVHAPSTGGYVRIDRLSAPLYEKGFLSARRIVPAP
jgi:cell wall-associated NlpC family hydrolase